MNKMQINRVYQRPEIKVIYVSIDSSILEASYPGDHQKGEHKTGPSEESSTGPNVPFSSESLKKVRQQNGMSKKQNRDKKKHRTLK